MLFSGTIALQLLVRAGQAFTLNTAAGSGVNFDHVVIIAMENQNYADVMGTGLGSTNAPFIANLLPFSSTIPLYHGYGADGRMINGCSAGCYVALISGSDQGASDGYSCCLAAKTVIDEMQTAGLTWAAYCEAGCPRGNDHFPFTGFQSLSSSPNIYDGSSVSTSDFVAAANSASPPSLLWYTPTDNHNMHDNSISSGDTYLKNFLIGSGSIANPASSSLLASKLFQAGQRTLLVLWWDEYDPAPILFYGYGVRQSFTSQSNSFDHYSTLRMLEDNWGLSTLTSNDAAATGLTAEVLGSTTPPPLTASFTYLPATPVVNNAVSFTAASLGGTSPYTYSWSFGDGSTSTGSTATHGYSTAGPFTVVLTVKDSSSPQQIVSSQQTVTVANPLPPALNASFSYSLSSSSLGQSITFVGSASGGMTPYMFAWDFGDGSTAAGPGSTHIYQFTGTFTVVLTVKDSGSPQRTATAQQSITVTSPPLTTSFSYSPSSPQTGQQVTYTASVSGGNEPYSYSWTFGDGASGTGGNATHTYQTAGNYTVALTVTDVNGQTASATQTASITGLTSAPLTAIFAFSPSTLDASQFVTFSGFASGGTQPYSFTWSFGDGSTGSGATINHVYSSPGTFTVILTVTDSGTPLQTSTSKQSLTVTNPPPALTASFTYSPSSPATGQQVTFAGSASGGTSPYSYSWSFGDGSLSTINPTSHTYSAPGSISVTLTATDSQGVNASSTHIITVAPTFNVDFTNSPASPEAGQPVTFTATQSGGVGNVSFSWAFGDYSSSTENPTTHTYTSSGIFLVTVTATDADGIGTISNQTVTVVAGLTASVTFSPSSPHAGDDTTFVGSASGGIQPYNYFWSFGDSTTGSGSSASHAYQARGLYTVILTVTDANNQTVNVTETITVKHQGDCHAGCAQSTRQTAAFNTIGTTGATLYIFAWLFSFLYNPFGLLPEVGLYFVSLGSFVSSTLALARVRGRRRY